MKKLIKISLLAILMIVILVTATYGVSLDDLNGKGGNTGKIEKAGSTIIGVASVIGSAVSVIVVAVLGIKYMLGSVDEKARYKETLLPYVIGAIFVFCASTIASIIYNVIK